MHIYCSIPLYFFFCENTYYSMASLPVPSGGDQNRCGSLLAMVWTEASIAIIVVSMRMYSRFKIKGIGTEYVSSNPHVLLRT